MNEDWVILDGTVESVTFGDAIEIVIVALDSGPIEVFERVYVVPAPSIPTLNFSIVANSQYIGQVV